MLMEVQKNIQELRNEFKLEIQSLRNSISEMKHTMEGFKSRLDIVEEMVNGIEIRNQRIEYREAEAERDKWISRNERILRELCDQSKCNNICIIGVSEEEEERKRDRKYL